MEIDWVLAGKVIWALCLATWAVIRWVPNRRARKVKIAKTTRTPSERLAMVLSSLGLGVIPAIWVFTGEPSALDHATNPVLVIIGLVIFLASLRLFRITHKALGAMWSHSLDLRENHKLVTGVAGFSGGAASGFSALCGAFSSLEGGFTRSDFSGDSLIRFIRHQNPKIRP